MLGKLKYKIGIIIWLLWTFAPIIILSNNFGNICNDGWFVLFIFVWTSGSFLGGVSLYSKSEYGKQQTSIYEKNKKREKELEKQEPSYTISILDSNNKIIDRWNDAVSIKQQRANFVCFRRRNYKRYISISGNIIFVVPNS